MVEDVKKLAQKVKEENLNVNVIAINMSKSKGFAPALDVHSLPTIRLYTNDDKIIDYPLR